MTSYTLLPVGQVGVEPVDEVRDLGVDARRARRAAVPPRRDAYHRENAAVATNVAVARLYGHRTATVALQVKQQQSDATSCHRCM